MSARDWASFRAPDFNGIDPMKTIALLPTAAIEQHGPHLPVGTDTLIAQGMLDRLRAACPDDLDVRVLPVQAVGKSNEHVWARGTLTLTAETALQAWVEIGLSVARAPAGQQPFAPSVQKQASCRNTSRSSARPSGNPAPRIATRW